MGNPRPGSIICGIAAVVLGAFCWVLSRLRTVTFRTDCTELLDELALLPHVSELGRGPG